MKVPPPAGFAPSPIQGGFINGGANGYPLRRDGNLGWTYEDGAWKARIAQDGTVRFDDKRATFRGLNPLPVPLPEGTPSLETSLRKGLGQKRRPPPPHPDEPLPPMPRMSPYRPDPAEVCVYPRPCFWDAQVTLIGVGGRFDMTDELLRMQRKDPARFQKQKFLTATAAFRQELAKRAAERERSAAIEELRHRLSEIEKSGRDLGQRRADMQALAAELDPNPEVSGQARALIDQHLRALGGPGLAPDAAPSR